MRYVLAVVLVLVGLIHLMPLVGVQGPDRLASLYGVSIGGHDLLILMRHRAVLLGLLGGFFVAAAFVPSLQPSALVMAAISVLSFLYLAWAAGPHNAAVGRVVMMDVVALALLVVGFVAHALLRRQSRTA